MSLLVIFRLNVNHDTYNHQLQIKHNMGIELCLLMIC